MKHRRKRKGSGNVADGVGTSGEIAPRNVEKALSYEEMLRRARYIEAYCFERMEWSRENEPAMVVVWIEKHADAMEQRRKVEKDAARILTSQGDAIPRSVKEQEDREAAEIIRSDLGFALPSTLASRLAGKVWSANEIKAIAIECVREIVRRWNQGGQVGKEAIP